MKMEKKALLNKYAKNKGFDGWNHYRKESDYLNNRQTEFRLSENNRLERFAELAVLQYDEEMLKLTKKDFLKEVDRVARKKEAD